jgi:hypothetical protein
VGTTVLNPGEETTVSFVTSMSRGMEGPHLFRVVVPVEDGAGTSSLVMHWRADFR